MAQKVRIGTTVGSTTAYVVEAQNHLLQKRQFAFDGVFWFYQPDSRSPFQKVNTMDVPDNAVKIMAAHTGFSEDKLREPPPNY